MKSIALTIGDPTSVGPEVCAKALCDFAKTSSKFSIHLFASKNTFLETLGGEAKLDRLKALHFEFHDIRPSESFVPGSPNLSSARRGLDDLREAVQFCLSSDSKTNLVTGPIHKAMTNQIEPGFTGQTGFISRLCRKPTATMMLAGPDLRVSLVTTHIPLKEVSVQLSDEKIAKCILDTDQFLNQLNDQRPLAVLGLNPHASDEGLMGNEEIEIIKPVIHKLKLTSRKIIGPLSPDTAFCNRKDYSAFICMYHDQALIPLKLLNFDSAVNLSLGLNFLRASVDHGTAFDIAGQNRANHHSYLEAIRYASRTYCSKL